MKHVLVGVLPCSLMACGTSTANYRNHGSMIESSAVTLYVDSFGELPACTRNQSNQLAYIKDLDLFRICNGRTWIAAGNRDSAQAATEAAANTVVAVYTFFEYPADLCLDSLEIACFFAGGDAVIYANGAANFIARTSKTTEEPLNSEPQKKPLVEQGSAHMSHQAYWDTSDLVILREVVRHNVSADILLHYDAQVENFSVYFDRDQDRQTTSADEFLFEPQKVDQ